MANFWLTSYCECGILIFDVAFIFLGVPVCAQTSDFQKESDSSVLNQYESGSLENSTKSPLCIGFVLSSNVGFWELRDLCT